MEPFVLTRPRRAAAAGATLLALAVVAGCGAHPAASFPTGHADVGALHVTGAYVPQNASPAVAAAYFTVHDDGPADTLLAVSSPVSADIGLHRTVDHGSTGEMVPVASIAVPAGGSVRLAPGGYHVMLMSPSAMRVGQQVPLTLHFAHAGDVVVQAPVVPLTSSDDDTAGMTMSGMG